MKRKAVATWKGTGMDGSGVLTTKSGALKGLPYSFKARFKNEEGTDGTNPEELIAAAHAGCFAMALSFQIDGAGFTPEILETEGLVNFEEVDGGFSVTGIELNLKATIPGIDKEQFLTLADKAKKTCPVSRLLSSVPITLNAELV
jgi:osmotically inducible protein OsmC